MTIDIQEEGTSIILKIAGDVDLFSSKELKEKLMEIFEGAFVGIVLDMEEVSYLDSMGVGCLLFAFSESKKKHKSIFFSSIIGMPRKVIQLTKLDNYFPLVESIDVALTRLGKADE